MILTDQEVQQLKDYIGNNLTVNQGMSLMNFLLNKEDQEKAAQKPQIVENKEIKTKD